MRNTLRRGIGTLALILATATGAAACTSATTSGGSSSSDDITAPGADALNGKGEVDITFWHAMSGTNGETLQKVVDQFNGQNQGKIKVTLNYKGQYDTALAAYKNASAQQRPDLMQMYDIGTRYMIDSKSIVPMQSFMDVDKYDGSDIQPNIAGYYTVDKKLYSMPFNTSMPLLYINREAFQKAGLDPDKPPATLDEIMADARKIKQTPGETVQFGFGATLYGWFVEQWNAVADQTLCDADNGRTGRVSKVDLANDTNVKLLQWWQQMANEGLAMKLDSNTDNGDNAFSSGTVAIALESTGSLGGFTKGAAAAKNPFTVGTGYYPKVDEANSGGPIIGGASLWIMHKDDTAKERAAWELVRFLASKQSQVTWHTSTGYFPISKAALTDPADQQWVSQKPQFSTAIQQLQGTKLTYATQGCSVGEMPDVRKDVENALQAAVLQGQDAKQALTTATDTANKQIADYNSKLGG
ncbi:ABC transporter substrate-binding protein [Amycolatopsis acidiphila]|uniref:ABC transporter substrate-binding protein n=1 Tax=Amycolatopsis acidiphila TaxID=715473 RepID=A0A557ZZ53_9PSEU|nr:ABC transporter substrate-binding protein [Amycolatopsis acidiphila]TVT17298.1 ABC transporter substrate-binding protein [Amycolatopsis acidiphila]UIJ61462.1 ABC transporter substrate-binding protein [Amycolatopsis acidiphila]GHG59786.1 ABC transporter substrate-binding protein [Amycolatopsis acidiphila]